MAGPSSEAGQTPTPAPTSRPVRTACIPQATGHPGADAEEPPIAARAGPPFDTEQQNSQGEMADADARAGLPPGAYRVYPGSHPGVDAEDAVAAESDGPVFEGFLPPPSPEDAIRREAEDMLRAAIILDESAVKPIEDPPHAGLEDNAATQRDGADNTAEERICQKRVTSLGSLLLLTLLATAAIAFGVAYGGAGNKNEARPFPGTLGEDGGSSLPLTLGEDGESLPPVTQSGEEEEFCSIDTVQDRYDHALRRLSNMTRVEILEDPVSPQGRALRWIACRDHISADLIDAWRPSTGLLPTPAHETEVGTDAGAAQVRRRYALATWFYATSEAGPWHHHLNFLAPDVHECAWHHNYTRSNWPFGEFDPTGFVCLHQDNWIMLSDEDANINYMTWNFRVSNNLSGTIPLEIGHIDDLTSINLEKQRGLRGSLPSTVGNPPHLKSISIQATAPHFGGVLPPSLFTNPSLEYISIQQSEGTWEFPPSLPFKPGGNNNLRGLTVSSDWNFAGKGEQDSGMIGTLPSYLSKMRGLEIVNFSGGLLRGTLPDALGSLGALEFLNVHGNDLSGTLPRSLEQLSNLTTAVFGENHFGGVLPSWLGNLNKLMLLDLSYNQFEGTIPDTFSRLASLEHISFQHNKNLNGSISVFEPLTRLSSLILYSNHFSSSIPEGLFSNFTGQIFADFGHNDFTGTLPQTFSRWASNTSYLATMGNNFDAGVVDDAICEQVRVFLADCSNSCSTYCCREDSTDQDDRPCSFDLNFYELTNLACNEWWMYCGDPIFYDPEPVGDFD